MMNYEKTPRVLPAVLQNAKVRAKRIADLVLKGLSLVNNWAPTMLSFRDEASSDSVAGCYGTCSEFSTSLAPVLQVQ